VGAALPAGKGAEGPWAAFDEAVDEAVDEAQNEATETSATKGAQTRTRGVGLAVMGKV